MINLSLYSNFSQLDGIAPTFSIKPTIKQDSQSKCLIFHCAIVADPKPTITWFRNGVKVQDDNKFQVVNKENDSFTIDSSLYLREVTVEDAGKYKVTARNDLGESNATISLNFDDSKGKSVFVKCFHYYIYLILFSSNSGYFLKSQIKIILILNFNMFEQVMKQKFLRMECVPLSLKGQWFVRPKTKPKCCSNAD